jgi:hypothetical protein
VTVRRARRVYDRERTAIRSLPIAGSELPTNYGLRGLRRQPVRYLWDPRFATDYCGFTGAGLPNFASSTGTFIFISFSMIVSRPSSHA